MAARTLDLRCDLEARHRNLCMNSKDLLRRLAGAVKHGVEARSAFYASMEIEDGQSLGSPADPELIQSLEARIGRALPPSYKAFLSLHNGWRMVDAETDLLPVEEMLDGPRAANIKDWQQQAAKWNDEIAAKGLVIGHSDISPSRILLDSSTITEDGEWRLLERYKDEQVEYGSFVDWLEQSMSDYEDIADLDDED